VRRRVLSHRRCAALRQPDVYLELPGTIEENAALAEHSPTRPFIRRCASQRIVAAALAASAMAGLSAPASAQSSFSVTVGSGYPGRYQSYDPYGGYNSYDRYSDRRDAWAAPQRWEQHRRWEQRREWEQRRRWAEEARRHDYERGGWEHRYNRDDDDD
jgi:hypothetical protein